MAINFAPGQLTRSVPSFDPTGAWTVAWWLRIHTDAPGVGQYRQYFTHGSGTGPWLWSGSYNDFGRQSVGFEAGDDDEFYDTPIAEVTLGRWTHVAVTYDPTTHAIRLYTDRTLVGSPLSLDLAGLDGTWDTGQMFGGTAYWGNFWAAQVRLWQATLSRDEIAAEADAPRAARRANLLADTPLSTVSDLTDYSGNGYHWTPSGSLNTEPDPPVPLMVRVGDAISTQELRPAEPPGPIRQVVLPAGYQFPLPLPSVPPYTDWYANRLTYNGPFPLTFTCCFWVQNLAGYTIKGVWVVYPDPIGEIELWSDYNDGIVGMSVALGTPNGESVQLQIPVPLHRWHHIAILRDGPTTFLSIDNRPWASLDTPGSAGIPWGSEWINAKLYQNPVFTPPVIPRVAYYRMWDVPLGLNELRREARARQAVRTANLWRDTPLEDSAVDISGAGRDWVVGVGGLVVPSYGDGPLPWVADPVLVREGHGPTAQGPGTRQAADLLNVAEQVFLRGHRDLPATEPVGVSELAAVGIARPVATTNRQKRWYTQNQTGAGFTPSGLRGPWTAFRDGIAITGHVYRLDSPTQLVTISPFSISAHQGARSSAGTAATMVCCLVHVTDPLPAQMISGVFNLSHYVYDQKWTGSGFTPRRFKVYVYVSVGSTNTVRGVLLDYTAPVTNGNRWPYAYGGVFRWWQLEAATTLTPVTLQAGDRVVVELGFASDAAWLSGGGLIGYYFSGSAMQNDSTPNAPGDNVSPNTQWTPGFNTVFGNSWVEFSPGIFVTPHGVRVYDYVTGLDYRKALVPNTGLRLADVIATADQVDGPQSGGDLYVRPAETITLVDRVRRPIYLVVREKPFSNISVTESVTRRLGAPVTVQSRTPDDTLTVADVASAVIRVALLAQAFELVTIQTSAGLEEPITFPPYIPVVGPGIGVFDTIRVREDRLRQVASSVLTVNARDYVTTIDAKTPAIYGTAWDGSGTPPASTPGVLDDYWLVGV